MYVCVCVVEKKDDVGKEHSRKRMPIIIGGISGGASQGSGQEKKKTGTRRLGRGGGCAFTGKTRTQPRLKECDFFGCNDRAFHRNWAGTGRGVGALYFLHVELNISMVVKGGCTYGTCLSARPLMKLLNRQTDKKVCGAGSHLTVESLKQDIAGFLD